MSATHYRWDDVRHEELSPTIGRRIITGERMMIAQVFLAKDAVVPKHSHENEQLTYIREGGRCREGGPHRRLGDDRERQQ